jgi:hypothetical protein
VTYYPTAVKNDFTTKINFTDPILAGHVNDLQDEMTAVQSTLGSAINVGSGWVGTFNQVTTNWNTVKDRLANIEYGLGEVYNDYISITGGSTLQPSASSIKGLIVKAKASQSANLVEFQTSAGTVISYADPAGELYTSGKKLVPIVYATTQPSSVPIGTIWVDSDSDVSVLNAQSGLPAGGTNGQYLVKSSNSDYAVTWGTISVPSAGTITGTTLAANIVSSSLTSVGTLTSLAVTNAITAASVTVTGAVGGATVTGNGAALTDLESTDLGILTLMGAWV